jgi:hypothetical protein
MPAKKLSSRFNVSSPSRGLGGLARDITALDQRALLILFLLSKWFIACSSSPANTSSAAS